MENFENSPLTESGSESGIPYSHMNDEEANIAFSARKDQIRRMLKARSNVQTPDSDSKCSVSSIKSKMSAKNPQVRFTAGPDKVSKHTIDSALGSQGELREKLKKNQYQPDLPAKKYDVSQPIYKRTVEWKQNLNKIKEELKEEKDKEIVQNCTFEPVIEKSDIRNLSVGIYERNVMWKNNMTKKHEAEKDQNILKEIEECSFKPKIIGTVEEINLDFQQRNAMWQERMVMKAKRVEEENSKQHVFYPKVNKGRKNKTASNNFDSRFSAFLEKLDQIADKIDSSLSNVV